MRALAVGSHVRFDISDWWRRFISILPSWWSKYRERIAITVISNCLLGLYCLNFLYGNFRFFFLFPCLRWFMPNYFHANQDVECNYSGNLAVTINLLDVCWLRDKHLFSKFCCLKVHPLLEIQANRYANCRIFNELRK